MIIQTIGEKTNPAILFFHAMGVNGESSMPICQYLKEKYYCILPTSTVYCEKQKYKSKQDEIRQVEEFLDKEGIQTICMIVASSIGADLAVAYLSKTERKVEHVFIDGGQFAQINRFLRIILSPILYFAIKSLYWTKGNSLKKILWCDDEAIKPYFIMAGKNLRYRNLRRQLKDSLVKKPFPVLSEQIQKITYFEFGSIEDHFKYRDAVKKAYPKGNYPIFEGYNHMQFQIKDPKGFAHMLLSIIEENRLPPLPFITIDK